MGEYYTNSLFNIAAVSSSDGNGGCFLSRDALPLTPCPVSIRFAKGTPKAPRPVFIRPSIGWDPVNEVAGFQRPPLWQRAWVVQERLLSPRTLLFSSMQMSWKCRGGEASERVPEMSTALETGQVNRLFQDTLFGLKKFDARFKSNITWSTLTPSIPLGTKTQLSDLFDAWYDLVSLYGKCFLTQPSDIFPAISGIARAIALSINDRYISGLWYQDLHRGLLWSAPDSTVSKRDLRHIRAPSWSWAALAGTSNFHVRQISQKGAEIKMDMFEIEGTGEKTSGVNTFGGFGSIEEVVLVVRGKLKKANPIGMEDDDAFIGLPKGGETLFDLEQKRAVGYYFPDNADRRHLTRVWCVPVMTEQRSDLRGGGGGIGEEIPGPVEARCLVLLRLSEERDVYMRVGSAWIPDFRWFDEIGMSIFSII